MSPMAVAALGLFAGFDIAVVTTPVGVSGAVFLLPIQLSLFGVPSPAVTPTNLLFNFVSIPGALIRYSRSAPLKSPPTRVLLAGTLPGVIAGAVIRVFAIPYGQTFRLFVAAVLLPLGVWLCLRTLGKARDVSRQPPSTRSIAALAVIVGVIGGIYGIGGGSLISPILVGRGLPVAKVAPAALTSTLSHIGRGSGHLYKPQPHPCVWPASSASRSATMRRLGKHAAVAVAENAAVQLAKLGGLLGLSPVAERGLGSFTPPDDPDDPFA